MWDFVNVYGNCAILIFWGWSKYASTNCILILYPKARSPNKSKYKLLAKIQHSLYSEDRYCLHGRSSICPNKDLHFLVLHFHPTSQMLEESISYLLVSLLEMSYVPTFEWVCPHSPRFVCLCQEGQERYCTWFHLSQSQSKACCCVFPQPFHKCFFFPLLKLSDLRTLGSKDFFFFFL